MMQPDEALKLGVSLKFLALLQNFQPNQLFNMHHTELRFAGAHQLPEEKQTKLLTCEF
jgi:hypothetical protein